jgi:hypothetical protein
MALTNTEKQRRWRERRKAYIRELERRVAQLEREQAKGKRPRRRDTDKARTRRQHCGQAGQPRTG